MEKADIILKSKAVFTGLDDMPFEGGVAVKGNKIITVFHNEDSSQIIGPETKILDYQDQMIMPGFVDAHVHYFLGSIAASDHMCTEIFASSSEEECVSMVKRFAYEHPDEKRIIGIGWYPANWNDAPLPTCKSLDKAIPDKPVYLIAADVHTFWMNTKALEEAGITGDEKLESGEIGKFEDGSLNGLLFEPDAFGPAMDMVMDLPADQKKEVQKDFFKKINSCGVTSVSEMSADRICATSIANYQAIKDLEDTGELSIRLHIYPALGTVPEYEDAKELRKEFDTEKIKISGLKQFIDGVTSTYTGYLLEPYADSPETRGVPLYPKNVYKDCVVRANRDGFGVRFHAIGDAAVRLALDAFEASNEQNNNIGNHKGIKNAIEHCETIDPDDLPRFASLGVIASMQPYHLVQDFNEKIVRLGAARSRYEWAHRSLLDRGAKLAFGTDYPVVDFNPFPSIFTAITRCDNDGNPSGINPEEAITLSEALKAYTLGGAYVYDRESEIGTLEAGKLADIVVIDKNLFQIEARKIKDCKVVLTMMDGKIVYEKKHENGEE